MLIRTMCCEICEENQAAEYCKDCSQPFCNTCKRLHTKARGTAHHQFISLDEGMKSGSGSASRTTRCEKHPQQEINTYCQTDKHAICPNVLLTITKGTKSRDWPTWCKDSRRKIPSSSIRFVLFLSSFLFLPPPLMACSEIIRSRSTMVTYPRLSS